MTRQDIVSEKRTLLYLARSYRAKGYKVTVPSSDRPSPVDLDGYIPDLVAQSANDNVVVEVKKADAVRGANDLVWLSKKIELLENWRLELVTVPSTRNLIEITEGTWTRLKGDIDPLSRAGFDTAAFLVLWTHAVALLASVATRNEINPANRSLPALISDLYRHGLLKQQAKETLDQAWLRRGVIAHEHGQACAADVDALLATCREFLEDAIEDATG